MKRHTPSQVTGAVAIASPPGSAVNSQRRALLQAGALAPWLAVPALATAAPQPAGPVQAFPMSAVQLLPGPFKDACARNAAYLLSLDPDRLLHNFRINAGLPTRAPVYGGWESEEPWVDMRCHGHTLGHYLSACAFMVASDPDPAFAQRVDHIVTELAACEAARNSGLVCAFPDGDIQLLNSLAGRPVTGVPWYTLHKVMAGLRDAHVHAGSAPALQVLDKLAGWIDDAARGCDDACFQRMLDVEHGGMNEVLTDLFVLTGQPRWLDLAQRFNHRVLLDALAEQRDTLDGLHANTQIPKVIGFARQAAATGQVRLGMAARYFWGRVAQQRSFATGGHGELEHFFAAAETRQRLQSAKTMETCGIHNMLRLTRALFQQEPSVAHADFHERALVNGILAAQDPLTGMNSYFQALRPGYVKLYQTPERSFWCCTGIGMENHAKYGDSVYFHQGNTLTVAGFVASTLHWPQQGLHLQQHTQFPDAEQTRLRLQLKQPVRLALRLRHPAWCRQATLQLNGQVIQVSRRSGRWLDVARTWHDGDELTLSLPMHLHLSPLPGDAGVAAVMLGPLVLAAQLGTQGLRPGAQLIVNERDAGHMLQLPMALPTLHLKGRSLQSVLRRQGGRHGAYTTTATSLPQAVGLVPYHRIAHERYNLYWQVA